MPLFDEYGRPINTDIYGRMPYMRQPPRPPQQVSGTPPQGIPAPLSVPQPSPAPRGDHGQAPPRALNEPSPSPPPEKKPSSGGNMGIDLSKLIGGIKLDEEKITIILLLIILARNGADMPLLIALGYLLM